MKFGNYEYISYFGIKKDSENDELRNQVEVLYYTSKEDFAIKLKTKQEDEIILCKNPEGKTFNQILENITNKSYAYEGSHRIKEREILQIPNIKVNEKTEFKELQDKSFWFSDGQSYHIEKAIQTIQFELDKTGGKIKSEAGMMVRKDALVMPTEIREFVINDTFAIFLQEEGKDNPYFAGKINDITKFR